jgi:quercetin dioxygenase-like cupin family protein
MRKHLTVVALAVLALTAMAQQAQAPVAITAEPHHHLVVENQYVRAFAFSVNPGDTTLMHKHERDYLGIFIGDSTGTNTKEGAQPTPATFKDGDVKFAAAGVVHAVAGTGNNPVRNATIELLQPTTNPKACTESCTVSIPCDSADKSKCVTGSKAYSADQWTVTIFTLPAGARYAEHTHAGPYLTIALADADVTMNVKGKSSKAHEKTGDIQWHEPETHAVTNTGKTPAKVAVLEFTPAK